MKINFNTNTILPMFNWLLKVREEDYRDEDKLRSILDTADYQVEFLYYNETDLPLPNIPYEEAYDFFMNFDIQESFDNERLEAKREIFNEFVDDIEDKLTIAEHFADFSKKEETIINGIVQGGLPKSIVESDKEYEVIFIISIGNKVGWQYGNYLYFDITQLELTDDKETFLVDIAHEIYNTMFSHLIENEFTSQQYFLVNFAYEGLAYHFCNNAFTVNKPSKYAGEMVGVDLEEWEMYVEEHKYLFRKFKEDFQKCADMSIDDVQSLIEEEYEQFTYWSDAKGMEVYVSMFPSYYLGCYFWGVIDLAFGKERLFEVLSHPDEIVETYNNAITKLELNTDYLL